MSHPQSQPRQKCRVLVDNRFDCEAIARDATLHFVFGNSDGRIADGVVRCLALTKPNTDFLALHYTKSDCRWRRISAHRANRILLRCCRRPDTP